MLTTWRSELPLWVCLAVMFVASAIVWPLAPESIPVHWNFAGQADRFGGRFEGLLAIPLISLALSCLLWVLPKIDPARANYESFRSAFWLIRAAILGLFAVLHSGILLVATGHTLNMGTVVSISVGVMLIVIGNVMGKIRPNWFVGVKTPWTLSSRSSWNKTHRLAGWLFIAMGLVFAAFGIWQTRFMLTFAIAIVFFSIAWMVIYSFVIWRNDPERLSPSAISPASNGSEFK